MPADLSSFETAGRALTINDIARLAGVSKKTVSRVINKEKTVKPATRDHIEAVIASTGYSPNLQARALAFSRSFLIGLIYDNPNPDYVVNMQLGLLEALRGTAFELVVHPCDRTSPSFLADLRGFVERQKLWGVVLTPSVAEDERAAALLAQVGCRYVRVASIQLDAPRNMIVTHDQVGAALAARHLLELGHRDIATITGPASFRSVGERLQGLKAALTAAGITLRPEWIVEAAYTYESGLEAARVLLAASPRPTAIFAGNDEMAAGVITAAREAGISTPGQLSVVGYDDFPAARRLWPPLTTIRAPTRQIGRLAAEKLMGAGDEGGKPEDPLPTLIVRGSTAKLG